MKIVIAPHLALSQKSQPIRTFDKKVARFSQALEKVLLNQTQGIGLAAPQVAKNWRIFVLNLPHKLPQTFINPRIITHSKEKKYFKVQDSDQPKQPFLEGCLSIPNIYGTVKRWPEISTQWFDLKGKKHQKKFHNLGAIVFQHEYDHLEGILFPQRVLGEKGEIFQNKNSQLEKISLANFKLNK